MEQLKAPETMSNPPTKQRARYALHTARLALRAVAFVFLFVSWALYIHRAVKCQDILAEIRHERSPPVNLPSDQATCWNQRNSGALRPFLLVRSPSLAQGGQG
jgi:hypothetical protein